MVSLISPSPTASGSLGCDGVFTDARFDTTWVGEPEDQVRPFKQPLDEDNRNEGTEDSTQCDTTLPEPDSGSAFGGRRSPLRSCDLALALTEGVSSFVDRISGDLAEDVEEAAENGEVVPTEAAQAMCLRVARLISGDIVLAPRLKYAAFSEESGGVSLVLQSLITDRRVNYRISPEGVTVSVIAVDECMATTTNELSSHDESDLRGKAKWVRSR